MWTFQGIIFIWTQTYRETFKSALVYLEVLWNFRSDLGFISYFLSNWQLPVVLDGKSSQEYPVNAGVSQGYILGLTLFLLYINDLPNVICIIAIYADDTTLYSKCDQTSNLWQQLELTSKLEFDLQDTVDWGRKWIVNFNAGKTQLASFGWSNNTGTTDVKMDGSVLEEKSSLKMLGLTFYIIFIAKTASKKTEALIHSMKFLALGFALYFCKPTTHPCMEYCCHVWTGAPIVATWSFFFFFNCYSQVAASLTQC